MEHRLDNLIALRTGFKSMHDMVNAGGNYRPSCDISDPDMRQIADAYDAVQKRRCSRLRAYRYGNELEGKRAGFVWVNQGKRVADIVAFHEDKALLAYSMPNGRSYYWEVPRNATWAELGKDGYMAGIRNVNQNKPPKRWAEVIAREAGK